MAAERSSSVRSVPVDLAAMVALTVLVNVAVLAPVVRTTPLRVPLGVAFTFFVPGYVVVAALFPDAADSPSAADRSRFERTGIDGLERVVLSVGSSVVIVPGIALLLNYTSWGIRPASVLTVTTVVTLLLTIVATVRRLRTPEAERFRVSIHGWPSFRGGSADSIARAEPVLTLLLIVAVLLATGGVGYAMTTNQNGERFSEVYLLGQDDGAPIADEYPTEFERGGSRELVVGVENAEHRTVEYTIVAVEQHVSNDGEVTDQRELEQFETRLEHGETWHREQEIEPTLVGENVRFVWLVYLDDVPDSPSMENAAYHVHLWADVGEPDGSAESPSPD
jgi:uncharacterized membrane protein